MFFQKNLDDSTPDWVEARHDRAQRPRATTYPLVNDLATLVWLAQMAALEIHVPQWRFGRRRRARRTPTGWCSTSTPATGAGLAECAEVARLARDMLKGMGLDPMPVTSGSKGIHLYAALDGTQTSDEVSAVAHELARALEADHPGPRGERHEEVAARRQGAASTGARTTAPRPRSRRTRCAAASRPTVAAPRTWRELGAPGPGASSSSARC